MRISTLSLSSPQHTQKSSSMYPFSPSFKHVMKEGTIRAALWTSFRENASKKQKDLVTMGIVRNSSAKGDKGSLNWAKREYWQCRAYVYGFFAKFQGSKKGAHIKHSA